MRYLALGALILIIFACATTAHATNALCLNCGAIHFGALNQCESCGFSPMPVCRRESEMMSVFIMFSDHYFSLEDLEKLGSVIEMMTKVFPDPDERLWAFFYYIVKEHSYADILDPKAFKLPQEYEFTIPLGMKKLDLPEFKITNKKDSIESLLDDYE